MTSVLEKTIFFLFNWIWKWIEIGSEKQFSFCFMYVLPYKKKFGFLIVLDVINVWEKTLPQGGGPYPPGTRFTPLSPLASKCQYISPSRCIVEHSRCIQDVLFASSRIWDTPHAPSRSLTKALTIP